MGQNLLFDQKVCENIIKSERTAIGEDDDLIL